MHTPPSSSHDDAQPPSTAVRLWRRFRAGHWTDELLIALSLLVLAGGLILWLRTPSASELNVTRFAEATVAYTADGEVLTRYHHKTRLSVPLDSISQEVVDATIATEDQRFYDHWGIDVRRLGGAVLQTLSGNPQGGSTITMQLARNAFPDIKDDFVLIRKIEEWMTALRMEHRFTKDEILEMYLNVVPFMYNAFGIEAAAQTYFQKPAIALDVREAATLVGTLKGTVFYNPVRNPERSHERRNQVLRNMVNQGYLSQERYEEIRDEPTPLHFQRLTRMESPAPYFAEYVRVWLDDWASENHYNLYTDGLKIYTTLDLDLQQAAEAAVNEVLPRLQDVAGVEWSRRALPSVTGNFGSYQRRARQVESFGYFWATHQDLLDEFIRRTLAYQQRVDEGLAPDSALALLRADAAFVDSLKAAKQRIDAGFVALDPTNGHLRAWVGGRDYKQAQYDHVAMAKRQPGSTFKPFVYAAALARGFRSTDRLRDTVKTYEIGGRTWRPTNFGRATGQPIMLRDALAYSKNTITAQLVDTLGPEWIATTAERIGIRSELDVVPSLGLGTSEVTLLELTAAYATFASQGRAIEPLPVTRIENRNGRVIATFSAEPREVIAPSTAYGTLDMMRGVVGYGTGTRIRHQYGAGGDLAAKTGTSQHGADGWFMLLHPDLIVGSWVGFASPRLHFRSNYWGQGAHTALHVVGSFYRQARRQGEAFDPQATFSEPLGYVPPDTTSRFPASDDLPTQYASDSTYRSTDSLLARTDSLLRSTRRRDTAATFPSRRAADSLNQDSLPTESEETQRRNTILLESRDTTTAERTTSPEREPAEPTTPVDPEAPEPDTSTVLPDTLQRLDPRSPTANTDSLRP